MFKIPRHERCVVVLWGAVAALCLAACSAKPQSEHNTPDQPGGTQYTHTVKDKSEYYETGPQQKRPPDGTLEAGTPVQLVQNQGSYSQMRMGDGALAFVATAALQEIGGPNTVEITDDVRAVGRASNAFAYALYQRLGQQPGNLFFSPASISTALAMTYIGAEGETKKQMAQVLHFDVDENTSEKGFRVMNHVLNSGGKAYQLSMANRLWVQNRFTLQPKFVATVQRDFGAEPALVDFAQSEKVRQEINAWVEGKTRDKIKDLIPAGVLDAMTRLVLANAIYFKGTWDEQFEVESTHDAPFHVSKAEQVAVPMMHQTHSFRYAETDELQLLEMPYLEGDLSMVVLLPKQVDGLAELEKKLSVENVDKWISAAQRKKVRVYLPKYKLNAEFQLSPMLRAMGMSQAFSDQADFSGISSQQALQISEVIHKAFVDVTEEGTEAAAATAVTIRATAIPAEPEQPPTFRADHPFVFAIRDQRIGAILFLGRVSNPKP